MDKGKARLIGKPIYVNDRDVSTNLRCVGNKIISQNFITSEGLILINCQLLIATSGNFADIYRFSRHNVDRWSEENYRIEYMCSREFDRENTDEFVVGLYKEFGIIKEKGNYPEITNEKFSAYSTKYVTQYYMIWRVEGQNFKNCGLKKQDTSGYMVGLRKKSESKRMFSLSVYFMADNGLKSDNVRYAAHSKIYISDEFIIDMGEYRVLIVDRATAVCKVATKGDLSFMRNVAMRFVNYVDSEFYSVYLAVQMNNEKDKMVTPFGDIMSTSTVDLKSEENILYLEYDSYGELRIVGMRYADEGKNTYCEEIYSKKVRCSKVH